MMGKSPTTIDISKAQKMITNGEVVRGEILGDEFTFEDKKGVQYKTVTPPQGDRGEFLKKLDANNVSYKFDKSIFSNPVVATLISLLPLGFIVLLWMLFMRQAQAGNNQAMSFGRSRAKRLNENVPKVTFDDVAGVDEAKQELQEVVEFLKNAKKFVALGAKIPKGVLLLGPPGSGKTLLARAIAGEAGVPFFHISGSDFVEMFVGVGASRVRDLFETAKANRPSLIFIDEIDAVGRQRGAGLGGGHDEREQTLNQLLVEMDGFDPNSGVILIAATNRPDVLDPALLRPGRFDRRVVVDNPDAHGREAILNVHLRGKPLADDVNVESLARRTPGFSGADLANLINEAALLAARWDKTKIFMADFEHSIDRVIAGPERKSRLISEKEKEMVAYHEVGHAIVAELLPNDDPVHKVSILPRGMALGYTMQLPTVDKYLTTKNELLDKIAGLLGGRVAEEMVFGEISTGASNDLERATEIVRAMVCEYGMSDQIGPLTVGKRHANPFLGRDMMEDRNYSEEMAMAIDKEIRLTMEQAYERAKSILSENREKMDVIVKVLLEKETLEREEFEALMEGATLNSITQQAAEGSTEDALPAETEAVSQTDESADAKGKTNPRLEPGMA
ncbi:MAG: ATP-dependent zinc metalloprotease FtsH [Armatimonadetes bacterium]|jgi:cell division protease FtsH|nr:ATP-dependent zinc metalloprotease FtsH [Armatimonadota bacterium]